MGELETATTVGESEVGATGDAVRESTSTEEYIGGTILSKAILEEIIRLYENSLPPDNQLALKAKEMLKIGVPTDYTLRDFWGIAMSNMNFGAGNQSDVLFVRFLSGLKLTLTEATPTNAK